MGCLAMTAQAGLGLVSFRSERRVHAPWFSRKQVVKHSPESPQSPGPFASFAPFVPSCFNPRTRLPSQPLAHYPKPFAHFPRHITNAPA
jgi:hypothetical protein